MGVGQLRQKQVVLNGGIPGSKVVANLYIPERTTATTGVGYDSEQKDDGILRKKINLLFGHANGFHKEHWSPVIKRIFGYDADFLKKGIEINKFIAIDFFHHGDSAGLNKDILVKCDKPVQWQQTARDIIAVIRQLKLECGSVVGIGHSFGATSMALSEIMHPTLLRSLILVEPSISNKHRTRESYAIEMNRVQNRRDGWEDKEKFKQYLKSKPVYASWTDEAIDIYAEYGLTREGGDNGGLWKLKCDPLIERYSMEGKYISLQLFEKKVHSLMLPTLFIRAEWTKSLLPGVVEEFTDQMYDAKTITIEKANHLVVMEKPKETTDQIVHFLLNHK